jgi:hypothetical protein
MRMACPAGLFGRQAGFAFGGFGDGLCGHFFLKFLQRGLLLRFGGLQRRFGFRLACGHLRQPFFGFLPFGAGFFGLLAEFLRFAHGLLRLFLLQGDARGVFLLDLPRFGLGPGGFLLCDLFGFRLRGRLFARALLFGLLTRDFGQPGFLRRARASSSAKRLASMRACFSACFRAIASARPSALRRAGVRFRPTGSP